jgi:hypothetical protein
MNLKEMGFPAVKIAVSIAAGPESPMVMMIMIAATMMTMIMRQVMTV